MQLYFHRSVASVCLQVFPRMANFTNTHKMTGVGNALKRHYQALCLDYELAHPEDLDKQVTLNTPALQVRIRYCLLAMGSLMGSGVQCRRLYESAAQDGFCDSDCHCDCCQAGTL